MTIALDLIEALKRSLRAQGLTYRDLAERLKLSEAAVKRMFSKRAMNLLRLEEICEVLGIGLAELGAEATRGRTAMGRLSGEQKRWRTNRRCAGAVPTINRWRRRRTRALRLHRAQ